MIHEGIEYETKENKTGWMCINCAFKHDLRVETIKQVCVPNCGNYFNNTIIFVKKTKQESSVLFPYGSEGEYL